MSAHVWALMASTGPNGPLLQRSQCLPARQPACHLWRCTSSS
jgi:hypothetical protein